MFELSHVLPLKWLTDCAQEKRRSFEIVLLNYHLDRATLGPTTTKKPFHSSAKVPDSADWRREDANRTFPSGFGDLGHGASMAE